ncbi:AAA+-type ATPase, SpoVK/Ycf46/Vps4 family [Gracilibacillus ureilyticus]|uniref:AAA+-type ATPase, SpoVK/Ycf46/Vps4 family n=1 Tax=Gracilibacillus ureilyticus TaxID=531814 RepID=A0A1H9LDY2_9BACI|nr:AAA family ATPase [Gracilibacillus ureilyticus]SER09568.1 AAA+-type ATPase, SpoVK/Ycf46/Vps4 family [Gracilibacillus ureilyticus]
MNNIHMIKEKLHNWSNFEDHPPFTEIELLRIIDHYEEELLKTDKDSEAILYAMLIYYRLKRQVTDDHLNELLVHSDKVNHPMVKEIQTLKHYLHVYQSLEEKDFSQYFIRETDFDPVKLKKVRALINELEAIGELKGTAVYSNSKLNNAYHYIFDQVEAVEDIAEGLAYALEHKKSVQDIAFYNEEVDKINRAIHLFYQELPSFLKDEQTEDPLDELNNMVGLDQVKSYINQYYHYLKYQQKRKEAGFQMIDEQGLHMVITGNPGTGKTTIARLLANIYYKLGLLESNKVVEVNRSQLVGSFMGQSEENTLNYVKKALGGVLFIDEAYNLKREEQSGNDYGQAVIDTLVASMTSQEYASNFAVIIAGYPEEMNHFLWANPGMRSRFPEGNFIQLPDFDEEELLEIAERTALNNDYFFTENALSSFRSLIEKAKVDESFGNARTVKDLVLKVIFHIGATRSLINKNSWLNHMRISRSDILSLNQDSDSDHPLEQLDQLIGLNNIKEEVKKLSAFVKVQQKRKSMNLPAVPIQLHAVFSGNPGTGKTTVAKIYAKILKDCGLLKRGHLIISSRGDLVAGYVGQTAMKTKNKIREALGGVLFIDEAYSLYRGEKDFGKEAIDTLVDEMTRHNENLVVILAGYKNEMERFISSNPGLESRFKKYFHFDDYTDEELLEMVISHTKQFHYSLSEEVETFLLEQFAQVKINGNGRFVVNLINEAIQYQALRVELNGNTEDLTELLKEDFELAWKSTRGINKQ